MKVKCALSLHRKKEKNKPLSQIISEIAEEMDLSEDSIENYLIAVTTFKPKYNADFYGSDEDEDYYSSAVDSADNCLYTEHIFFYTFFANIVTNFISLNACINYWNDMYIIFLKLVYTSFKIAEFFFINSKMPEMLHIINIKKNSIKRDSAFFVLLRMAS